MDEKEEEEIGEDGFKIPDDEELDMPEGMIDPDLLSDEDPDRDH